MLIDFCGNHLRKICFVSLTFSLLVFICGTASASSASGLSDNERGSINTVVKMTTHKILREPTEKEIQILEKMREEDIALYIQRVKDFQDTIEASVKRAYNLRRQFIEDKYKSKLAAEEELEDIALINAIEYFEKFLKKYPDEPTYTPDAMFRLAELYYDSSYISYLKYLDEFTAADRAGKSGEMPLPDKDFSKSIELFERLVAKYPDYENVDGAYYLLGYCLKEEGREEEARLAWLNLVCPNKYKYDPVAIAEERASAKSEFDRPSASLYLEPAFLDGVFVDPFEQCASVVTNSRFFFESWWLIGNYHFDYDTSRFGVETAISAYKKLVTDETHQFYDKGLYKLAWSYYKADMYPEAIEAFAKVVDFSDASEIQISSMRPEAIQYLAVCFFAEDWDGDMMPDAETGIQRLQDPRYIPQDREWLKEVYNRLGEIYSDNERDEEAITVWTMFLEKWPLDREAPFVQDKIADSYRKLRLFEQELAARSKLENYGEGSPWWNANADDPEAQIRVLAMAQDALINSAITHHQNAQSLRARANVTQDEEIMQFALEEYALAANAYRRYLEQNPQTPDAYTLNYQLADALFWSGNYTDAKDEYISVRDSNLDDRFRLDSSRMVIICIERIIENEVMTGTLAIREEPPALAGDPPTPVAVAIPQLLKELMEERENFLKREPNAKDASIFDYQSAQNYYRYGHWDEAKQRYLDIYDKYCAKDEISVFSWQTLLKIAVEQHDLDTQEKLALMEKERKCGEGLGMTDDEGLPLDTVLGDVAMQRAMDLFRECLNTKDIDLCSEAGDSLVAAVAKAPDHPSADAALHNGALAYETAQRNNTAMQLYGRIVNEYPQSQWVDKCLFKQGYSANAFFEYEQAMASYKMLADEKRFADSEYRIDAVLNMAMILTNLQDYRAASSYWTQYASLTEDSVASIEANFNAADMYFRDKAYKSAVDHYEVFIKKYRNMKDAGPYVVRASYRLGLSQKHRNRPRDEQEAWRQTVAHYKQLVNDPGSISAEYAAESEFNLIELDMKRFEVFKISGTQKQIDAKMTEGAETVKSLEGRYRAVQQYLRPSWSLAAAFRMGYAYEVYAKAILDIPPPPLDAELQKQLRLLPAADREMVMMEYEDRFRMALEGHVSNMEQRAQTEYKIAIELARKGNISNEWSLLALERMNAYDPDSYPRQHNGITIIEQKTVSVPSWAPEAGK